MQLTGKAAYEKRKQEKKDGKIKMDMDREARERREAKADALAELAMDSLTAFLTGKAFLLLIDPETQSRKRITFHMGEDA